MKSLSKIYLMAVFSVKCHKTLLPKAYMNEIFSAITKILNDHGKGSRTICVGGIEDHVHVLFTLSPDIAISDLMREVKSRSSRWINENHLSSEYFQWQRGYGVFSYSQSSLPNVINYVKTQSEHHRLRTFREEFLHIIEKYDIVCDPRDLTLE